MICTHCAEAGDLITSVRTYPARHEAAKKLIEVVLSDAQALCKRCIDCPCQHKVPKVDDL